VNPVAKRILLLVLVVLGAWQFAITRPVTRPDGVLAPDPPVEQAATDGMPQIVRPEFRIEPIGRITMEARVLGRQSYPRDRYGRLSPLDLLVGWGSMSDSARLRAVDFAQSGRVYVWQAFDPALPDTEVAASTLLLHVVASTPGIEDVLGKVRVGQVVKIGGVVLRAIAADQPPWQGREIRIEAREGRSRVVYVESLEVN
jgi:hypothetical protein